MSSTGIIGFVLIVVNFLVSYNGFNNRAFFDNYKFDVDSVMIRKDFKRLITGAFLHVNWLHLIFNMLALFFFSGAVEGILGIAGFLLVYFGALLGGHLLSLLIHRHDSGYSAVGASGAVGGVMFASIALAPSMPISLFFIPIPGWLFGLAYTIFSIYGIRSRKDNIGHDAHLGGSLIGMLVAVIMKPQTLIDNYWAILLIAVPAIAFIVFIILKPHYLLVDNFFYKHNRHHYSIDHSYNEERYDRQKEVDRILEKIHKKGMKSLTQKERDVLNEHSRKMS